jgi:hypothetical protein
MNTTEVPRIVSADSEVWRCWNFSGEHPVFTPDPKDIGLLNERQTKRLANPLPLEGDWVEFADGVTRRISYVWFGDAQSHPPSGGVQTSDATSDRGRRINGGSWHLQSSGNGNFSGGLYGSVPVNTLTDTGETRPTRFWFFHRDHWTAHNAVHVDVNVRVWQCSEVAPK